MNKSWFSPSGFAETWGKEHPFAEKTLSAFVTIPTPRGLYGDQLRQIPLVRGKAHDRTHMYNRKNTVNLRENLESLCQSLRKCKSPGLKRDCYSVFCWYKCVKIPFPGTDMKRSPQGCRRRVSRFDIKVLGREKRLGKVFAFYAIDKMVINTHVNQWSRIGAAFPE